MPLYLCVPYTLVNDIRNNSNITDRRHTLDLAASALAGLASTEDFTKVLLRKTAGPNEKDEFRGTKPTMLIHIKGTLCINQYICFVDAQIT